MTAYPVRVAVAPAYRRAVSLRRVRAWAAAALTAAGQPPGASVDLAVVDDDTVRALNRSYRGVDEPTDVLAFPYTRQAAPAPFYGDAPPAAPAQPFVLPPEADGLLGEVVIAYPYAERQARAAGHAVADELALLVVHGVLHLVGYDHENPTDQATMWAKTNEVLAGLGVALRL